MTFSPANVIIPPQAKAAYSVEANLSAGGSVCSLTFHHYSLQY
jgi:hypothetical protein